jgi:hypothetical protein
MTQPMHSTTAKLFATAKRESQLIHSDAWGVDIELRGMTMGDRSTLLSDCYTKDEARQPIYRLFYPTLLRACCFDPTDGTPLFVGVTDEQINSLPAGEVERVCKLCLVLSGIDGEASKTVGNGSDTTTMAISSTS